MKRLRHTLAGLMAVALMAGAVWATGMRLTGNLFTQQEEAFADFTNCGQGIRVGGDVKLRGVLVGTIGSVEREQGNCRIGMKLFPEDLDQVPENIGAAIQAKTIFGEKFVALLYPDDPAEDSIAYGDIIPTERTLGPLELETIFNTAMPLLEAIDPEHLAATLEALNEGFIGHEDAIIRGAQRGEEALAVFNDNKELFKLGLEQLEESSEIFSDVDEDLLAAFENLIVLNRFTVEEQALIEESLNKAPVVLGELSTLFETRFTEFTKIVDRGATVIGILASRANDLDLVLDRLPKFNASWIRNISHVCRRRQPNDHGPIGEIVPGRCWRVHNIISHSRGAYPAGEQPQPGDSGESPDDDSDESAESPGKSSAADYERDQQIQEYMATDLGRLISGALVHKGATR